MNHATIIGIVAVIFGLFGLASVKVENELKMTKAYDRQAAALERIADYAAADYFVRNPKSAEKFVGMEDAATYWGRRAESR